MADFSENIEHTHRSIDTEQLAHFATMAQTWWDPEGPFKPLHMMTGFRLAYIKQAICNHFGRPVEGECPLHGLTILDVGCGGGLLCEPLTRLGATLVGIDALEKNIHVARLHAQEMGLSITYRHATVGQCVHEAMSACDVVLNMEVLEHVRAPRIFIADCARMLAPNGLMMCATINRTFKAFVFAIVGAEYILRWLPRGTHQYEKFIRPQELQAWLQAAGLIFQESVGMKLNPVNQMWRLSADLSMNYVVRAYVPN